MEKFKKSFLNVLSVVIFSFLVYTGCVVLFSCVWGAWALSIKHPVIVGVPVVTAIAFFIVMVVSAILRARDRVRSEKSK